jgi:hypothetical protein
MALKPQLSAKERVTMSLFLQQTYCSFLNDSLVLQLVMGTSPLAYGHFAYVAFCLQIFCSQNDTLFRMLCHLAYRNFAYRNRLDATKLCVKWPVSVFQMRQNLLQHLSHSANEIG